MDSITPTDVTMQTKDCLPFKESNVPLRLNFDSILVKSDKQKLAQVEKSIRQSEKTENSDNDFMAGIQKKLDKNDAFDKIVKDVDNQIAMKSDSKIEPIVTESDRNKDDLRTSLKPEEIENYQKLLNAEGFNRQTTFERLDESNVSLK